MIYIYKYIEREISKTQNRYIYKNLFVYFGILYNISLYYMYVLLYQIDVHKIKCYKYGKIYNYRMPKNYYPSISSVIIRDIVTLYVYKILLM